MNIFGIGELELVLIIVIALVVAGPKRMIQWMYIIGRAVARLRNIWAEASVSLQQELRASGLDVDVPKDVPTRGDLRKMAGKALAPFAEPVQDAIKEVKSVGSELQTTAKQTREQVNGVRSELRLNPSAKPANSTNGSGSKTKSPAATTALEQKPDAPSQAATSGDSTGAAFGTWSGSGEE